MASLIQARQNCIKAQNHEWFQKHTERLESLVEEMPSGSGIDCGTKLDLDASTPSKLVFTFSFHHMNESGMYDGWTDHKAVATPDFAFGFYLVITGRDRNGIKEYLHDVYSTALSQDVEPAVSDNLVSVVS